MVTYEHTLDTMKIFLRFLEDHMCLFPINLENKVSSIHKELDELYNELNNHMKSTKNKHCTYKLQPSECNPIKFGRVFSCSSCPAYNSKTKD